MKFVILNHGLYRYLRLNASLFVCFGLTLILILITKFEPPMIIVKVLLFMTILSSLILALGYYFEGIGMFKVFKSGEAMVEIDHRQSIFQSGSDEIKIVIRDYEGSSLEQMFSFYWPKGINNLIFFNGRSYYFRISSYKEFNQLKEYLKISDNNDFYP